MTIQALPRKSFSMAYYVTHPSSRGFVHIRSGIDAAVPPEFETGFLKECVPWLHHVSQCPLAR